MNRDSGSKSFPMWLIADSSPPRWENCLVQPLDPRHPARHSIWTPILEGIQSEVFRAVRGRVDTTDLYVRNAVRSADDRPSSRSPKWPPPLEAKTLHLGKLLAKHSPKLVLTFGAFAFEFTRRSLQQGLPKPVSHWTTSALGREFKRCIETFDPARINLLPLLHVSIARGHFLRSHQNFTGLQDGNYFDYVGCKIATLLLAHEDEFSVGQ